MLKLLILIINVGQYHFYILHTPLHTWTTDKVQQVAWSL